MTSMIDKTTKISNNEEVIEIIQLLYFVEGENKLTLRFCNFNKFAVSRFTLFYYYYISSQF